MPSTDLVAAARGALLAEVGWRAPDGGWHATVLVPLTVRGTVTFALPYAQLATADALAGAERVVVVCSDARLALAGWEPVAAWGSVEVEDDPAGRRFRAELLDEELRKHPPARLLADSLLQQRENWWYLPRLLVHLTHVDATWPVTPRGGADTGVLFASGPRPATTVEVVTDDGGCLDLAALDGADLPATGPAVLLRHDCSVPDLEQRAQLEQRGRLHAGTLAVEEADGRLALPGPGLLDRYRRTRAFERACRRALAAAADGTRR